MTALPFAPTIDVVAASSPSSFAAALPLLVAARSSLDRLLYELIGIDLASAQPSSRAEFADPSAFYSPRDGRLVVALVDGVARGIFGVRRLGGR